MGPELIYCDHKDCGEWSEDGAGWGIRVEAGAVLLDCGQHGPRPGGDGPVLVHEPRNGNAGLMVDCRRLGYLSDDRTVIDVTYGTGRFWRDWRPRLLTATTLAPQPKGSDVIGKVDFTDLSRFSDNQFIDGVIDGPYKLNGAPSGPDASYGVDVKATWQQRHALIMAGMRELDRVCSGFVLVKCQPQVSGGHKRWQDHIFATFAENELKWQWVDRIDYPSYRPQPEGRKQKTAHVNASALLVFKVAKGSAKKQAVAR